MDDTKDSGEYICFNLKDLKVELGKLSNNDLLNQQKCADSTERVNAKDSFYYSAESETPSIDRESSEYFDVQGGGRLQSQKFCIKCQSADGGKMTCEIKNSTDSFDGASGPSSQESLAATSSCNCSPRCANQQDLPISRDSRRSTSHQSDKDQNNCRPNAPQPGKARQKLIQPESDESICSDDSREKEPSERLETRKCVDPCYALKCRQEYKERPSSQQNKGRPSSRSSTKECQSKEKARWSPETLEEELFCEQESSLVFPTIKVKATIRPTSRDSGNRPHSKPESIQNYHQRQSSGHGTEKLDHKRPGGLCTGRNKYDVVENRKNVSQKPLSRDLQCNSSHTTCDCVFDEDERKTNKHEQLREKKRTPTIELGDRRCVRYKLGGRSSDEYTSGKDETKPYYEKRPWEQEDNADYERDSERKNSRRQKCGREVTFDESIATRNKERSIPHKHRFASKEVENCSNERENYQGGRDEDRVQRSSTYPKPPSTSRPTSRTCSCGISDNKFKYGEGMIMGVVGTLSKTVVDEDSSCANISIASSVVSRPKSRSQSIKDSSGESSTGTGCTKHGNSPGTRPGCQSTRKGAKCSCSQVEDRPTSTRGSRELNNRRQEEPCRINRVSDERGTMSRKGTENSGGGNQAYGRETRAENETSTAGKIKVLCQKCMGPPKCQKCMGPPKPKRECDQEAKKAIERLDEHISRRKEESKFRMY